LPYKLIVFLNKEGHVFSQLQVSNNSAYSNQSDLDTTDEENFAHREVLFDAMAMSVTNSFGGGAGARRITASFDESVQLWRSPDWLTISPQCRAPRTAARFGWSL
jgi:hypothetical protein